MYDNIHTNYEDAKIYISEVTAPAVIDMLINKEIAGKMEAETYAYLSKAYVFAGNEEMSLSFAYKSIEANPYYVYGYIRIAFAYARIGEKDNVLKFTQKADKLNYDQNPYINAFLVVLYNYLDNRNRVKQLLTKLEDDYVNTPEYNYYMGFMYSSDNPEKAIDYLLKAEKAGFKDKYNLYNNLAENYSQLEDFDMAEYYADKCLEMGDGKNILRIKAECRKENAEYNEAIIYLKRKYKKDILNEDKLKTLILLIYCSEYSNNPKRTEGYINFAMKNFKADYNLYYVVASYYENTENYYKAIDMYKHMLKLNKDTGSGYSGISYCYSQIGDNEKALRYAEKAIQVEPELSYTYYRKARVLVSMKDYPNAISYFEKSLDYDRSDVDSFQWISYCYSILKNYEKSLEYANRAILLDKEDSYSYFRKAWAYQELGRFTEAVRFYEECIKYDNKYVDAYLNISYIYSKLKDTKQSLLYANKALLINKDYSYAHYRKAWALQESGRYQEAVDGYSRAIELDPTDIYNYLGIACISLNNDESANALLYANKALFIDRNCGGAYYYKSLALSNLGRIEEAQAAYAKAISLGYSPN